MRRLVFILMLLPCLAPANSNEDLVLRHLKDGMKLLEKGRDKDALAEFKVAAALAPERADVQEALRRAEKNERSGAALPTVEATPPSDAELKAKVSLALKEARGAYGDSSLNIAASAWRRALQLDSSNREAKEGLALIAEESYKKDPDAPFDSSVADLYEAAIREARKERLLEARKKLDEALSLNPSQAQLKALLAKIETGAFAQGASRQADEALREADRALQAGEWAACRHAYDEALRLRPDDKAALLGLSRLKIKAQGAVDELLAKAAKATDDASALTYYKKALEIDPAHQAALAASAKRTAKQRKQMNAAGLQIQVNALYNQGVEAWQAGQLALASERFKQVLEISPNDGEAIKALESVRSRLGGQIDKDRAAALELMKEGADLESKGKLRDVLASYRRAAAKDAALKEANDAVTRLKKETQEN